MLADEIFSFQVWGVNIHSLCTTSSAHLIWLMTQRQEISLGSVYYSPKFHFTLRCSGNNTIIIHLPQEKSSVRKAVASQLCSYNRVLEGAEIPCNFVKERKIIPMHLSSKSLKSLPPTNLVGLKKSHLKAGKIQRKSDIPLKIATERLFFCSRCLFRDVIQCLQRAA